MTFIKDLEAGIVDEEYASSKRVKIYRNNMKRHHVTLTALCHAKNVKTLKILEKRGAILKPDKRGGLDVFIDHTPKMNDAMLMHNAKTGSILVDPQSIITTGNLNALKAAIASKKWHPLNRARILDDASKCGHALISDYVFLELFDNPACIEVGHILELMKNGQFFTVKKLYKSHRISGDDIFYCVASIINGGLDGVGTISAKQRTQLHKLVGLIDTPSEIKI